MSLILLVALTGLYVLMVLYFIWGVLRARGSENCNAKPSVSVVVPLHNEEKYVSATLDALNNQDYDGEWEVICVNDRSTDKTPQILTDFAAQHPRFRVLHIPLDMPPVPSPKKRALELGFSHARHEILMTMDADCIPPPEWVKRMAARFEGNIAIVQGPKKNNGNSSLLHAYQRLDTLGFTLIEAAGFTNKSPMVASAAALAYRKDLFFKVGGFKDLMQYTSGDDDMLVHKMIRESIDYCYNMDPRAAVETAPVHTWRALLNQRARWASNGTRYNNPFYVLFLTLIYTFICWLALSPWLAVAGFIPWSWWYAPFLAKFSADSLFLSIGGYRLKCLSCIAWLPLVELIQIPLIAIAVPMGALFKRYRWH